jgi:multidrug resistance efflux pump
MNQFPRFRDDLHVRPREGRDGSAGYDIQDPRTGARYEFDEQTLALLQSFDGQSDDASIQAEFNRRFGTRLTTADIAAFRDQAADNGLLTAPAAPANNPLPGKQGRTKAREDSPTRATPPDAAPSPAVNPAPQEDATEDPFDDAPTSEDRWVLFNPSGFFTGLARALRPLRWGFVLATWSLVGLVPLALYTLFDNQAAMNLDLARLGQSMSYFARLLFGLLLLNLLRCLIQGTLIAYYGGAVRRFGIRLRFGIIPRFFIDKRAIGDFNRHAKLWTWGANLLFRLLLFALATLTWYLLRASGSSLAINAIVISHAALITFLLLSLPLRPSDGYRWLMTVLGLPLGTLKLALHVLTSRLTRKPLPTSITPAKARRLMLYALALVAFWSWAFVRISGHIAGGLIESFPQLFGEATEVIILLIVVLLMLRWGLKRFARPHGGHGATSATAFNTPTQGDAAEENAGFTRHLPRLLLLVLLIAVLALPFPYRPGGQVELLPPQEQEIQAPVSGKLIEVRYRGGDGTLIAAGETLAVMVSNALEAEIDILAEQIREQEAALAQRRAKLAQIRAGERPETIAEATASMERAREEVAVANRQLDTARVTSEFSDRELERVRQLPPGVISALEISRSEKQAAVDRQRILELETTVLARRKSLQEAEARLALLTNGPTEEAIEIARQEVTEAEAALRRLERSRDFAREQLKDTELRMPFAGFLVDAHLERQLGRVLAVGETFARAQAKRAPQVEMILPEAEVAGIDVGASADIRLQPYPTRTFSGSVIALEPTGSEATFGRTFKVLIELRDFGDLALKPGMSGYGKIHSGYKPLYVQLSRPLLRFAAIEVWSWVP